jgi:hypothetical protein
VIHASRWVSLERSPSRSRLFRHRHADPAY